MRGEFSADHIHFPLSSLIIIINPNTTTCPRTMRGRQALCERVCERPNRPTYTPKHMTPVATQGAPTERSPCESVQSDPKTNASAGWKTHTHAHTRVSECVLPTLKSNNKHQQNWITRLCHEEPPAATGMGPMSLQQEDNNKVVGFVQNVQR